MVSRRGRFCHARPVENAPTLAQSRRLEPMQGDRGSLAVSLLRNERATETYMAVVQLSRIGLAQDDSHRGQDGDV